MQGSPKRAPVTTVVAEEPLYRSYTEIRLHTIGARRASANTPCRPEFAVRVAQIQMLTSASSVEVEPPEARGLPRRGRMLLLLLPELLLLLLPELLLLLLLLQEVLLQ